MKMAQSVEEYIINGELKGGDFESYWGELKRFGSRIKALEFRHVSGSYAKQWTTKILRQHIDHIERLTFANGWSKLIENGTFSQPLEVTHLIFRRENRADCGFFPKCRNLQKLEIRKTHNIWYEDFQQIIYDNPTLQSLKLYEFLNRIRKVRTGSITIGIDEIIMLIADHLNQLKELAIVDTTLDKSWHISAASDEIYKILNSFQHLESLAVIVYPRMIELLQRLGVECKQMKHLELHQKFYGFEIALLQVMPSFTQIESLHLAMTSYDKNMIGSAVEHLTNLRHLFLCIDAYDHRFTDLLSLFCKCQSLEKITHSYRYYQTFRKPATFVSIQFFEKFLEMVTNTRKPDARIDVMDGGQIIGSLTVNGLVWRNKLMHWIDCGENSSSSNVNLLNLANQSMNSWVEPEQNLLDAIFDYLDVFSLCSMAETNTHSYQLVKDYIARHSQQRKTFNITDEFDSMDYDNRIKHFMLLHPDKFAQCVTDLQIGCYAASTSTAIANMIQNYKFLNKLTISGEHFEIFFNYPLPTVRHIIFDTPYFMGYKHLNATVKWMPKAEIIEFKKTSLFNDFNPDEGHRPIKPMSSKLKTFIFVDRGETQRKNLSKFFKNN